MEEKAERERKKAEKERIKKEKEEEKKRLKKIEHKKRLKKKPSILEMGIFHLSKKKTQILMNFLKT